MFRLMNIVIGLVAVLGLSAIWQSPARAAQYVVDGANLQAADTNAGTAAAPWKTINHAAQVAVAGDVVTIEPGLYREAVVVANSGTSTEPIIFQAAKAGTVIVTGMDPLTGWERVPGDNPVYTVAWAYSFYTNPSAPGLNARLNPMEPLQRLERNLPDCVLFNGSPLWQALALKQSAPGRFFVDWDHQRLYVWLPGGTDPNTAHMLGGARSRLFAPAHWRPTGPASADCVANVTVKGLTFRYNAGACYDGMIGTGSGWRLEDVVAERGNGMGISLKGDGIVLLRCTTQNNAYAGFGGGTPSHVEVLDCVDRWNNWKGFAPDGNGSGGKWLNTDHIHMNHLVSYGNFGPGIWFDTGNTNMNIENCVVYGNQGGSNDYAGMGIHIEINHGPCRIANNICYSNTGPGISLAESNDTIVEGNTLVDNGDDINLRAMPTRPDGTGAFYALRDDVIRNNMIKDWRHAAIATFQGKWSVTSAADRQLTIDGNTYDPPAGKPWFVWGDASRKYLSLAEAQQALGVEKTGQIKPIPFALKLVTNNDWAYLRAATIANALRDAKVGDTVVIPAFGRTEFQEVQGRRICYLYDHSEQFLQLTVPAGPLGDSIEQSVPDWLLPTPVPVLVQITALRAAGAQGLAVGLGGQIRPLPAALEVAAAHPAQPQVDTSVAALPGAALPSAGSAQPQAQTFAAALQGAQVGDIVVIPVFGRTDFQQVKGLRVCDIFDRDNQRMQLTLPASNLGNLFSGRVSVSPQPRRRPLHLRVQITQLGPKPQGIAVGLADLG